jgi:hypothetical protein
MNPETNKFEPLHEESFRDKFAEEISKLEDNISLFRPDGTKVPKNWTIFTVGELVEIKHYTFKVAYINESTIIFEPVSSIIKDYRTE